VAFDAGAIVARASIDQAQFDRDLHDLDTKARKFEREPRTLKFRAVLDQASLSHARQMFQQLDRQISQDASQRMKSGSGSILGSLNSLFSTSQISGAPSASQAANQGLLGRVLKQQVIVSGQGGSGGGGIGAGRLLSGTAGGIGPGILGLGAKVTGIAGLGGSLLGALPTVGALGAGIGTIGAGALALFSGKNNPLTKELKSTMESALKIVKEAAGPLIKPIMDALKGLVPFLHQIEPELHKLFAGAAPLVKPLIGALEQLVKGLLPGLVAILHAAGPAFNTFAQVMGLIGRDLGGLFKALAPAIRESDVIFKALFSALGALFPIVGKLAAVFAKTLAPVFPVLANLIKQLEPTLTLVGKIIAQLAGAVLGDLVAAFQAIVILVKGITPALNQLVGVFGQIFKVLENAGVFAILGDALEAVAKPLARLISALIRGLAPALPGIVRLVGSLAGILVRVLAAGISALIPPLIQFVNLILKSLAPILPPIEKALTQLGRAIGAALVSALKALLPSLASLVLSLLKIVVALLPILPPLVQLAAILIELALKVISPLFPLLGLLARLIADIITPVADLLAAIVKFSTQWKHSWADIKQWASDAWHFIWDGFGKFLLPLLGPVGLIALGAIELAKHWHQVLSDVKGDASDAWQHLVSWGDDIRRLFTNTIPGYWDDFWNFTKNRLINPLKNGFDDLINWVHNHFVQPIQNIFTNTIPNAFRTFIDIAGRVMTRIEDAVKGPVNWVITHVLDGLIGAFDWISGRIGGPHIPKIPALAAGGKITQGTHETADDVLIRVSKGETVLSGMHSRLLAPLLGMAGVPGYATGGRVGQNPPGHTGNPHLPHGEPNPGGGVGGFLGGLFHKIADVGKIIAAITTGNSKALTNAIVNMIPGGVGGAIGDMAAVLQDIPRKLIGDAVKELIGLGGGLGGNGGEIVKYAMSFLGKIPYVWGGTAVPGGADCSGFVQTIYRHFGIDAPRTSEAQGSWVKRGPPVPGGLAFYHSPAGGADPGHVAIVRDAKSVISQGGGMGPQLIGLHALPLLWTGAPPGGGLAGRGGLGRAGLRWLENLWMGAGGPGGGVAHIAAAIALAESSGRTNAINPSGASGLWQILGQVVPGNIFNPHINALNAVKKWRDAGGFSPWVTWTDGQYRQFMDKGGWMQPGGVYSNALSQPEAVLTPPQSQAFISLADAAQHFSRGGGATAGGTLMRDVYLTLPEGTTVAQAMQEIKFQLKVAELQGFAGVTP
jgi:phage-related protein